MYPGKSINPNAFKNTVVDSNVVGFQFETKILYYRGITLSIIHDLIVEVDGVKYPREAIRFTVNGETFTLNEMATVISNRWLFGQYAKVTVLIEGGLASGAHKLKVTQVIAPSYMPMILNNSDTSEFTL
jgi:hypothetical protein